MHTRSPLTSLLCCSTMCLTALGAAVNPTSTTLNAKAASTDVNAGAMYNPHYSWLATADGTTTNNSMVGQLGGPEDRKYTCTNPRAKLEEGARAQECLDLFLRFPMGADMFDFLPRNDDGGYVPTQAQRGRCIVRLEYIDTTVRQERASWMYMLNAATAMINLCKRGPDLRVQGEVTFGEQGLLKLIIKKAATGVGEDNGLLDGWNSTTVEDYSDGIVEQAAASSGPAFAKPSSATF